ncbi:MAG: YbaB/EbfC family nucleoid-associated protein [Oscillospiraceae bacterium]|jgi:DNA-binding YbaB/EbfC family protein|nr:YbaB/EbfC family nucleoid-associated protein [Oscillospiraceae bacterium]
MKARLPDEYRGGQAAMMKQLQKVQEDMERAQREVEESTFSASVGGGAVQAECNGRQELTAIKISPEVIDPQDAELLEDLVLAAVNEALLKAGEAMSGAMERAQGGMAGMMPGNLPGLF